MFTACSDKCMISAIMVVWQYYSAFFSTVITGPHCSPPSLQVLLVPRLPHAALHVFCRVWLSLAYLFPCTVCHLAAARGRCGCGAGGMEGGGGTAEEGVEGTGGRGHSPNSCWPLWGTVVTTTQKTCSSHISCRWDLLASFPGHSHLGMRLRIHLVSSVSIYSSATM